MIKEKSQGNINMRETSRGQKKKKKKMKETTKWWLERKEKDERLMN